MVCILTPRLLPADHSHGRAEPEQLILQAVIIISSRQGLMVVPIRQHCISLSIMVCILTPRLLPADHSPGHREPEQRILQAVIMIISLVVAMVVLIPPHYILQLTTEFILTLPLLPVRLIHGQQEPEQLILSAEIITSSQPA